MPFRRSIFAAVAETLTAVRPVATVAVATRRTAIIDIGSNSVRLVVYDGPARLPAVLFNEKVMAGLGRDLAETGAIADESMIVALDALARFRRLADLMRPDRLIAVATAAVRDAFNGVELIERARRIGVEIELISGDREAEASAYGVLSAIPDADGLVGDLGGGSLELVRVAGGQVHERLSLPLGVLRLDDRKAMQRVLAKGFVAPWLKALREKPFYLVGGSWRALAKLDMYRNAFPLPILHGYRLDPDRAAALAEWIGETDTDAVRKAGDMSAARAATIGHAAALTAALVERLKPSALVVSAYGLREGLLFETLSDEERRADPLLVAAREEGTRRGRFAEHGDLIADWTAAPFAGDNASAARLRRAACLLSDVGWRANPDFRAELGREVALHGNWVGVDAAGRAIIAQTLHAALEGGLEPHASLVGLAPEPALVRASAWGLAIRVAQSLSGGVAAPLETSGLQVSDKRLELRLPADDRALYGEAVARRMKRLAAALGLEPVVVSRT